MNRTFLAIAAAVLCAAAATVLAQRPSGKPQTFKGLEATVASVERTASVGLSDCPPGANTVKGMAKPGVDEFVVVMVSFTVSPSFKAMALKRPTLKDQAGKAFNTAVSFVDVDKTPSFSCTFPFRVPVGTKIKSLEIETMSFDLTPFQM